MTGEEYSESLKLNQDKGQIKTIIEKTNPWMLALSNGNAWLRAEVLSAVCLHTLTFLADNLACHKIRIANTPLTEMHVLSLLCHHKKLLPVSSNATNFNLNLQRRKRRSHMHSKILITY